MLPPVAAKAAPQNKSAMEAAQISPRVSRDRSRHL
jgi:hypothetical protein